MRNKKNSTESKVPDMDAYAHKLYLSDFLRAPIIRSAIPALQLPSGSRGLDAGCGIGSHTLLLAEAVGPGGHVTGLDLSPEFLVQAREIANKSHLSEQVSFLEEPTAQTFVGDFHAPLSDDVRSALMSLFQMRWGEPKSEVTREDWAEYQRLCQSGSPDFILNLPDYYAFFTYSMFRGKVVK